MTEYKMPLSIRFVDLTDMALKLVTEQQHGTLTLGTGSPDDLEKSTERLSGASICWYIVFSWANSL